MARSSSYDTKETTLQSSRRARSASASRAAAPAKAKRGRILVIDDEPIIGAAVRRTLRKEHDVTVVTDGREALELIAGGEGFDLLLCDVMMPNMNGMELFSTLAATAPETSRKMVFFTGGAFTERAIEFLETVPNARLEKPFDPDQLRSFIRDRLR
jgi:CheY-like chemotaxis protein